MTRMSHANKAKAGRYIARLLDGERFNDDDRRAFLELATSWVEEELAELKTSIRGRKYSDRSQYVLDPDAALDAIFDMAGVLEFALRAFDPGERALAIDAYHRSQTERGRRPHGFATLLATLRKGEHS